MRAEPTPARRRLGSALAVSVFLAAALPRLVYLAAARPPYAGDYWDLASGLRRFGVFGFGGFQTTAFEPLYPFFLAAIRLVSRDSMPAAQVAQALVAAAGAVLLARLTLALTGSRRTSLLAAGLYAVYPLLIRHAADPSDTALAATLLIGFANAFVRADGTIGAGVAGAWLGLAALTRSVALPIVPLAAAVLLWRRRPAQAAACAAAALLVVLPWGLRNAALNGWPLPTRSGLNLFISNSPYTPDLMPDYGPDILVPYANTVIEPAPATLTTPEQERYRDVAWSRAARAAASRNAAAIAWLKVRNLFYFFSPRLVPTHNPSPNMEIALGAGGASTVTGSPPRSRADEWIYALSYGPVLALAVIGVYRRRRLLSRDAILWCVLGTFAITHAVYFPTTRYRVVVEFVLLVYAAVALNAWAPPRFGGDLE